MWYTTKNQLITDKGCNLIKTTNKATFILVLFIALKGLFIVILH